MLNKNKSKIQKNLLDEKNSFDAQFFARKSKKKGYVTIYCHISINKKRTDSPFTTGIKIPEKNWNKESKIIKGKEFEEEENERAKIKSYLYQKFLELENKNVEFDSNYLKKIFLKDRSSNNVNLVINIKKVSDIYTQEYRLNNLLAEGTKKRIIQYHLKIVNFLGLLEAEKLEKYHLDNFFVYLTTKCNNSHNVAVRTIEFLNAALKNAYEKGYLSFVPCNSYSIKRIRTEKKAFLTKSELQLLLSAKFKNERLSRIRDVFVFCCYTGMDYSSYLLFSRDLIKVKNDIEYIDYTRVKTGFTGLIPLFPTVKKIAEKYDYQLPFFANQNFNKLVKEVCFLAGITEEKCNRISTHSGRVTAGMIWLNAGIRIEVVSKMLGHASIQTTQRSYAEIELDTILKETKVLA